jgi:hypothetical protein
LPVRACGAQGVGRSKPKAAHQNPPQSKTLARTVPFRGRFDAKSLIFHTNRPELPMQEHDFPAVTTKTGVFWAFFTRKGVDFPQVTQKARVFLKKWVRMKDIVKEKGEGAKKDGT